MEDTISLREFFGMLKKRILLILIIALVSVTAAGAISFYVMTPTYQSSTQILVNQNNSNNQSQDVTDVRTNIELVNTYNVIIKSPVVLNEVAQKLNLERSADTLDKQINVRSKDESQVISIIVQDPNPETATKIANTTAEVFQKKIKTVMNIDNVNILSKADTSKNPSPVSPKPMQNMVIALVAGTLLGVAIASILEFLDNSIRKEEDIEQLLEIPPLGAISKFDKKKTT
ncbi:Wzz/FepE/Etk N-terminal domain-containing protein [Bacillus tianshenii]|nr:Wzz/FepE/Etk N-terminal domain-containing protein [Bacillus tianshenii]